MIRTCPTMDDIVAGLGPELTEEQQRALQEHLEHCDLCRAQFQRMGLIVRYLSTPPPAQLTGEPHLSDLDLAAFAHARFGTEDSQRILRHLLRCPECRQVLAAARLAMDDFESQQTRPTLIWEDMRDELRLAISTPKRALLLLGAALTYITECFFFAVALGQLILAYVIASPGCWVEPSCWPLSFVPEGPARLWTLVVGCVALGFVMRFLAARLYKRAVVPPSPVRRIEP